MCSGGCVKYTSVGVVGAERNWLCLADWSDGIGSGAVELTYAANVKRNASALRRWDF